MRRSRVRFGVILLLAVLISGVMTFYSQRSQVGRIGLYTVNRDEVKKIQVMLEGCTSENYVQIWNEMAERLDELNEYLNVLTQVSKNPQDPLFQKQYNPEQVEEILSKYTYSEEQAAEMERLLNICLESIEYVTNYDRYIKDVHKNVNKMMGIKLFSDRYLDQLLKADKDFYGLENVKLQISVNVGLEKLLENQIGDVIALFCVFLSAWLCCVGCKESSAYGAAGNSGIVGYTFLFVLGIASVYLAETYAVDVSWGLGNLGRSVQSVEFFQSCPHFLSIGMLLGIRLLLKCQAMMIGFLLCVGIFLGGNKIRIGGTVLTFICMEILLKLLGMPFLFQGLLHSEELIGKYSNTSLFGNLVSSIWILVLAGLLLLVLAAVFAGLQQKAFLLTARERAEQKYFEEVDTRYTETRMLRHDINNHLSAVAILLKENKTVDAVEYLQQVMDYFDTTKPPVRTGINVLDAVLLGKVGAAKEKGIRMEFDFREHFAASKIPDYELCSVFGNLLDNAVTACEKLPEEKRTIRLQVSRQLDMLCIFCENPYLSVQRENGRFVTQKADSKNHGMGIRQLERIAAKYDGTVEIKAQEGSFAVSVLLCDNK